MQRLYAHNSSSVPERSGGEQVLKRLKQTGDKVSRLTTIWTDGGFDGPGFMMWVMDVCHWIVQVVLRPEHSLGLHLAQKTLGGRAYFRLGHGVSPIGQQTLNSCRKHRRHLFILP